MAGDYEIIQAVHIGDREIVVGENQADEQGLPYLVAYYESNAILGRYYDAIGSDDFTEIMEIYGQRIMEQAQKTRVELSTPKVQGIDNSPITAERCTPISYDDDLNGKVIVIKPEVLRPEYRRATSQVKLCTGGFGADPHSRGSAVFCTEVYTGRQSRFERRDVLGVLEPEDQPKWVQHYMDRFWGESSVDGLTFCVGKYGINNMEITIGDEINQRHNAIITGAVGQGKSNLISVIIHSLCMRYSPRELQMYLLDFKEGVTFKAFSNIGQPDYLPHARTLGLESDVSFGLAVLNSLFHEYQSRMKLLKEKNAKSIRELRLRFPEIQMPRIVVVIDEFQMMFGDDNQTGQKIADMLEKSVRLFRAAGIHFILASQTLIGNMALAHNKDSIFGQIPIRIALKNSESEARAVLSMNNAAAAFVRPREAVVNLDYGELSQNRKTVIAFADEAVLRPIRRKMWEEARGYTVPPYVFESERRVTIANGIETIQQLRETARVPVAMIGNKISIDGERITLPMLHEPGRNMAILGAPDGDCNQAVGILQSAAASLAAQHPKGDARFMFCDFEGDEQPYERRYPQFASMMENLGFFIEDISREQFSETIQELMTQPTGEDTIYIFGSTMDRWEFEPDPFGQASPLKDFVEKGPARRIHFIGWWVKASKFTAQTAGFGNSDAFNSKIFLRIDERTIQSLTSPFIRWSAQANRGLIIDDVEFSEEIPFIPYAPVTQSDANAFRDQQWS